MSHITISSTISPYNLLCITLHVNRKWFRRYMSILVLKMNFHILKKLIQQIFLINLKGKKTIHKILLHKNVSCTTIIKYKKHCNFYTISSNVCTSFSFVKWILSINLSLKISKLHNYEFSGHKHQKIKLEQIPVYHSI